jgi:hypothetical protein
MKKYLQRSKYYWRARSVWQRAGLAWRVFRGRPAVDDGYDLRCAAAQADGMYGLEYITPEGIKDYFISEYSTAHPRLDVWAARACARVANKWDGSGHVQDAAYNWARGLICKYAADEGAPLTEIGADAESEDA